MSAPPGKLRIFFSELRRRKVSRLATIYAVTGLGIIEAADIIAGRFILPEGIVRVLIILLLIGFPLTMILGWIYDITPKGIQKTEDLSSEQKARVRPLSWKPSWISVVLFCILIIISFAFFTVPRPNAMGFKGQDWILLADLENNTEEEVFDRSLLHALTVTIDQSKRINIYPRHRIFEVLQRMQMDSIKSLDLPVALEIAERENIKVVLNLSISELGGTYILIADMLEPGTGQVVRSRQVKVEGTGKILYALDELAGIIQKDLGESLQKIHLKTVPLPEATTPSLEALKAFSKAMEARGSNQYGQAYEFFLQAIKLDTSFALAHAEMGMMYYNSNNREVGERLFNKALGLIDRLTMKERLWIEALVAECRRESEAAVRKWGVYLREYPKSYAAWFRLGYTYMIMGNYEESIDAFLKAKDIYVEKDPSTMINIASCYNALGNYQKAIDSYLEVEEINPDELTYRNVNNEFGFAYVKMGETGKAREVFERMLQKSDAFKARGYRSLSILSMYEGKLSDAIGYAQQAIFIFGDDHRSLGKLRNRLYLAKFYQIKGMSGEFSKELFRAEGFISEVATEPLWYLLLGKMFVRNGAIENAEKMLDEISSRMNPENKWDEAAYNLLKGELELSEGNLMNAQNLLEEAVLLRHDSYSMESLANYYQVAGEMGKAISVYEEMTTIDKSIGWESQECWLLAHYSLGKIYDRQGNTDQAILWYQRFLGIWKEADVDLPDYVEAKSRLEALTGVES